jgi:protein-S-isoprenylcysteine O-methyltransferase Ste14
MNDHIEEKNDSELKKNIQKRFIQVLINFIVLILILFISAGKLAWLWAWIYIGISLFILILNSFFIPKEVIAERGKKKINVKKWDKIITTLNIVPTIGVIIVSGMDFRFSWSQRLSIVIHIVGILLMIFGNALFTWSMMSNKYFSTLVRIQFERNHTVSTGGPYSFVRHPGYVGYILFNFATTLILGSLWALVPAGIVCILLVIRTGFEDRTLKKELDGYNEYAKRVKYRLMPGIW